MWPGTEKSVAENATLTFGGSSAYDDRMSRRFTMLLPVIVLWFANCFARSAPAPDIQALFKELNEPDVAATNSAAKQIYDLALKDPAARDYVAQKLPTMISANAKGDWRSVNLMWLNAVRLAGQLKLETTIPALIQSLVGRNLIPVWAYDQPTPRSGTFARDARLENDIVARALADIGDPATPAVADVLANGDTRVLRLRAAWILININTPAARKAMSDRLQIETDPGIKQLLEKVLEPR